MTDFLFGLAAGEATEHAAAAAEHATEHAFHIHMPHEWLLPNTPFAISNVVFAEWVIGALLIIIAIVINKAVINGRFTKLRGSLEMLLDFLEGWYGSFIGSREYARKYMPLLGSLFLFIIISNYLGIVPTVGYKGSLFAPTGRWGTTLGLAIVVAIAVQIISIKEMGTWGWIKHLFHLGPLSLLEEFVRPFSLSLRLFGNIFGEETLLAVIVFLAPYIAPIPIMGLSLLFGAIQAIVFTTLTAIYIGGVLEHAAHAHGHHGHEEHGHEAPAH
ncbi:MAG TPA: FoF1 ATP synthase subunit a [Symbiobacteriaceae bacterium]|nr:FoF1 ATP synthase subunit a [Symbiobacteriaceae bacterium]